MGKKLSAFLFVAAVMVMGTGCASMKIEKDKVSAVKKVAVIGFSLQQQMPNTGKSVLEAMSGANDNGAPGMAAFPAKIAEPADHALVMYKELTKMLKNSMSWQMIEREKLVNTPAYHALFLAKTKQPQLRPLVSGKNVDVYIPEGIIEPFLLNTMKFPERKQLVHDLNVDAIVMVDVRVQLINEGTFKKLVGAGEFHPQANVAFRLYDGVHEDPIWMDAAALGDEVADGVAHGLGFASVKKLNDKAVEATESAYKKLMERYRKS